MDATRRPLRIPPKFAIYAENHGIFDLYQRILECLVVIKPDDPLAFIQEWLKRENDDVPSIVIQGPPASGKTTLAKMVCAKIRTAYLTTENLIEDDVTDLGDKAKAMIQKGEEVTPEMWVGLLQNRLKFFDCIKKGWLLEGFPRTREETHAMQVAGIFPKHFVLLEAPDAVLIERQAGKRVDPDTGDVYHLTFDWPADGEVEKRLVECEGEDTIIKKLIEYHRHLEGLLQCYKHVSHSMNADQPKSDVFAQVMSFLSRRVRSVTLRTPRIILLGPTGAGKKLQAALISKKYNIVHVSCGHLLKENVADETKLGLAVRPYLERAMMVPDNLALKILDERFSQLDCVSHGWVLTGYPLNREQAEILHTAGHQANRVFVMDIPDDSALERLTLRFTDPITGERYHSIYNPPPTYEAKDRLSQHITDTEDSVKQRLSLYHSYKEELTDYYTRCVFINADQDTHTVFEFLESMIVNPLPNKLTRV